MTVIEERLAELGIELPPAPQPVASYIPVKVVGDLAWVAAQIPMQEGAVTVTGSAGADVTIEEANAGARRCAIQALAALRAELGSLDRVKGIVKVDVFVASAPGFTEQPAVANGASDLLVEVFGDEGRHARAAVGVAELPLGAAVEVGLLVQLG
ncbi:MAG TPA: RidA family protein [Actinomycetota bacterium]|nr:RidA family protein [Actinomycetota bacterium]